MKNLQDKNVLFICTGNSARSILAEALVAERSRGQFAGFSAGSHPAGVIHAGALRLLRGKGFRTDGLRSKSWDEFAKPDAPAMDFIFTVCDNAASEACPYWPGHPASAHWGVPDPAAVQGSEAEIDEAFERAFVMLDRRIRAFLTLPFDFLDEAKLQLELARIGEL